MPLDTIGTNHSKETGDTEKNIFIFFSALSAVVGSYFFENLQSSLFNTVSIVESTDHSTAAAAIFVLVENAPMALLCTGIEFLPPHVR